MKGLFDLLNSDDPAIRQGLLQAGVALLGSRGNFGQSLGQGLGAGLLGTQQFRDRQSQMERQKLQDQLLQGQVGQMRQQQDLAQLPGRFIVPPSAPTVDATGGMETAGENPANSNVGRMDLAGLANAYMAAPGGLQAGMALQQSLQKTVQRPEFKVVGGSLVRIDGDKVSEAYKGATSEKTSSLGQMIAEMNALPPGSPLRNVYQQAIDKASTHGPGVSVNYGQPVAGVNAQGDPVFFQPQKGGGAPAIVPGVKPAPQNRDTKLPAELQRMQIAGDSMVKLMDDYEAMLKKHNPRDPVTQANPAVRADMQALKRNIELQFKELQALGALAGPDIEIMRQSLSDPFTMAGAYYGRDGLLAQVKRARELVKTRADAVLKSQGKPQQADDSNNDPLGLR